MASLVLAIASMRAIAFVTQLAGESMQHAWSVGQRHLLVVLGIPCVLEALEISEEVR